MNIDARPSFGSLLKEHRLAQGLSQAALAERAGLSRDAISLLERGLRLTPRRDTVTLLAKTLKLSGDARARLLTVASEPRGRLVGATPAVSGRDSSLPLPLTRFVGREREIALATGWLATARLLTVTGPPGTGKTRLAIELATRLRDRFAGGVHFIPLAAIADSRLVLPTTAQMLDIKAVPGRSPLETLREALRERQVLLVLDNFEQVLDSAPGLTDLLTHCAHLRLVVTSRAALRISGEREFPLAPLEIPTLTASFAELSQAEAVQLFVSRVQDVRPAFALTPRNAATIGAICRQLDGLPLALELAAGRSRLFPPQGLLTQLRERLPVLVGGARDLPARHQTLRAAIAWSYDLLGPKEQALFRRLGVFVGGCSIEALDVVTDDGDVVPGVVDQLEALVTHSLVQQAEQSDGTPRFRLLETMREYALERRAASGELAAL